MILQHPALSVLLLLTLQSQSSMEMIQRMKHHDKPMVSIAVLSLVHTVLLTH